MRMIDDPDPHVRASAFRALGQDRGQVPIDLLLKKLMDETVGTDELVALLESLYKGLAAVPEQRARAVIREYEDLLIRFVMREEHMMIGFNTLCILNLHPSAETLAITERAAREHPEWHVQNLAKSLLSRRKRSLGKGRED